MAQISLNQAAAQRRIPRQMLDSWIQQGLLTPQKPENAADPEKLIEEDELDQLIESLGWLQLSEQGWENAEER